MASHCIDRPVRVLVVCAVKLFRDKCLPSACAYLDCWNFLRHARVGYLIIEVLFSSRQVLEKISNSLPPL